MGGEVSQGAFTNYIIIWDLKKIVLFRHNELWRPLATYVEYCDFKYVVAYSHRPGNSIWELKKIYYVICDQTLITLCPLPGMLLLQQMQQVHIGWKLSHRYFRGVWNKAIVINRRAWHHNQKHISLNHKISIYIAFFTK